MEAPDLRSATLPVRRQAAAAAARRSAADAAPVPASLTTVSRIRRPASVIRDAATRGLPWPPPRRRETGL
jgi:hypothetical protein